MRVKEEPSDNSECSAEPEGVINTALTQIDRELGVTEEHLAKRRTTSALTTVLSAASLAGSIYQLSTIQGLITAGGESTANVLGPPHPCGAGGDHSMQRGIVGMDAEGAEPGPRALLACCSYVGPVCALSYRDNIPHGCEATCARLCF
jgi:hypothetical protein